jgi:RNA polymerase sigma-70 factor (ECF subfamily)
LAGRINQSDFENDEIEEIIQEYYDDIYKYCYWKTKNSTDAQDITQETFLRFMQNLVNYVDMGKPKALLYTIARNLFLNWQRKPSYIPIEIIENNSSFIISNENDTVIDKLYLHDAVSLLPSSQQDVLLLRYGQGLQVGEIATILSISRFTVMYRLKCAINKLKKMKIGED